MGTIKNIYPILQRVIDKQSSKKADRCQKSWFHYAEHTKHEVIYDNIESLSKLLDWPWHKKLINKISNKKKKRELKCSDELIVLKSLNGALLLNLTQKYTAKVINKIYEPNFLDTEITARQLLPNNVPKIISAGEDGNYYYIVSELVVGDKIYNWDNWKTALNKMTPLLKKAYLSNNLQTIDSKKYVADLKNSFNHMVNNKHYLLKEIEEIKYWLSLCLNQYMENNLMMYKTFQHGDLVPNNLLVHSDQMYIIDWANGGIQNYLYDLMIQNYYSPQRQTWKNFNKIDFINNSDHEVFYGWTKKYIGICRKLCRKKIINKQIKISRIIDLAEIAEKNFLRHQTLEEYKNGEKMLNNVIVIYKNIYSHQ